MFETHQKTDFLGSTIRKNAEKYNEMLKQMKTEEEPTMKVTYKGLTGELVRLERTFVTHPYVAKYSTYDLVLSVLKEGAYAEVRFTGVKLADVKFSGCEVSFCG